MTSLPGTRASRSPGFKAEFYISVTVLAVLLVALALLASVSRTPVWRLVLVASAAHLAYGAAMFFAWRTEGAIKRVWAIPAVSLALRLLTIPSPPTFSDDVYRYVWDGRMIINGINPYRRAPDDPALEGLRDEHWSKINHKPLRTIYPPLGQALFGAVAAVCPRPVGFKIASALADVGVVCMVLVLAGGALRRREGAQENGAARRSTLAALAYGLNPLACIETGMSGHLEPAAVFVTLLALYFLQKKRGLVFGALVGLGAGIKLAPVLVLPIVRQRRAAAWLIAAAVMAAVYLPFSSAGLGTVETLDAFARRWEGNAGLFSLTNGAARSVIASVAGVDDPDSMVRLKFLDGPAAALQDTFFSLHKDGGFDPAAPGAFALGDLSLAISKIVLGLAFAAVLVGVALKGFEPLKAAVWIFGALMVVTPILHPWYLLWILPLAAVRGAWPWMIIAALSTLSYLPLDGWWERGVWAADSWIQIVEWGAFAAAGAVYFLTAPGRRRTS